MKPGEYISCVFCNQPAARPEQSTKVRLGMYTWSVKCYGCKASGPEKATEEDAVKAWMFFETRIPPVNAESLRAHRAAKPRFFPDRNR